MLKIRNSSFENDYISYTCGIKLIVLKSIVLILLALMPISLKAQTSDSLVLDSNLIQLSGVVISEEDLEPMPYTTIYDKTIRRGVIADYYGYFSTVVFPGDTLIFSYFGYKTSSYIVPDTLTDNRYSIIHMLQKDTLNLPEVHVYPWPSKEDFARAFVEMRPYDDAIRRAQRELSGESLAFVAARLEGDASLAYGTAQQMYQTQLYRNGQLPGNNLLNPYAWAKLIKDWKEGKLARQ
jgi:hypothetical protein